MNYKSVITEEIYIYIHVYRQTHIYVHTYSYNFKWTILISRYRDVNLRELCDLSIHSTKDLKFCRSFFLHFSFFSIHMVIFIIYLELRYIMIEKKK